jgi:HD-like signal output (HDOD) protein
VTVDSVVSKVADGPVRAKPIIVFVDDEEAILAALRSLFRKAGYATHAFTQATEALEFIGRIPADILISDLRMPLMTGIEFLNHASAINPQAVRIMLSGYEDKSVVMSALSKGLAQHYVLKPWEDDALRELVSHSLELLNSQRKERLTGILGSIDTLPAPPQFHAKVHQVLDRDGSSVTDIAAVIEKSPPIVAKLLRVANSVYYGSRKTIVSVHDAVFFIGTEYVVGLVAAIEAFHGFACASRPECVTVVEKLWSDAVQRSSIAKKIAVQWPGCESPETVYVASLLQDIGQAVLLCFDPDRFVAYQQACEVEGLKNTDAERAFFGNSHDAVGAALLEYWNFPPAIVGAVSKHHVRAGGEMIPQILQLAELLQQEGQAVVHDPALDGMVDLWRERVLPANETTPATSKG